jgi:hypothetical protein
MVILGVPDPEQPGDLSHRCPVRVVVRSDLGIHPDRTLLQLSRIPLAYVPCHDSNLPKV